MAFIIAKHNGPRAFMTRCRSDVPEEPEVGEAFEWSEDVTKAFRFATRRIAQRLIDRWWPNTKRAMRFVIEEIEP